jgi:small-conductance mechanosensitive channel
LSSIVNSVKRFVMGLVLLVALAAGTLFLFSTFVLEPINLSEIATQSIKIILIISFWVTILIFINRSKPLTTKHLGEQTSTILQFFMGGIAVLVMLFAILNVLNVPPQTLITGAGFASITIGLIVSTFVGGILAGALVFFTHKFRVGDLVMVNNLPGKVTEINALVTRIRTEIGNVTVPNNAISSGAIIITRIHQHAENSDIRLPYLLGDRIATTYMGGGEGTVKKLTPIRTVVLLDTGRELTFLNSSVLIGSIAVAKITCDKSSET